MPFTLNLPEDHFIQKFIAYGSEVSDAYRDYWFAGAIFSLAVAADKKIKVVFRQGTYYPNLYISINGKSTLSRKTTSVDKVEDMLRVIINDIMPAMVPTEFSPEAFIEHMSDYNHAPWIRDEAAGVLEIMKKDYMRGFKDTLMSLYDCKSFHRQLRTGQRKAEKDFRVDDPYLNVMWATTDSNLAKHTTQSDIESGFLLRFLFFFPQGKKDKWMPLEEGDARCSELSEQAYKHFAQICDKSSHIEECTTMHLSPEATAFYNKWQLRREKEIVERGDGFEGQVFGRLVPTVVKLAMLFELGSSDFNVSKPIRLEFIQEACRLADEYFMLTAKAIYEVVGSNAEKNGIDRITLYLKSHSGGASTAEILRNTTPKMTKFELDRYLETMDASETIEIKKIERQGKGRDTIMVYLKQPDQSAQSTLVDEPIAVSSE